MKISFQFFSSFVILFYFSDGARFSRTEERNSETAIRIEKSLQMIRVCHNFVPKNGVSECNKFLSAGMSIYRLPYGIQEVKTSRMNEICGTHPCQKVPVKISISKLTRILRGWKIINIEGNYIQETQLEVNLGDCVGSCRKSITTTEWAFPRKGMDRACHSRRLASATFNKHGKEIEVENAIIQQCNCVHIRC